MITSSPGPTPAAARAKWSDTVPLATATPWRTPQKAAKPRSNSPMKAPSELIQPERIASITLAISSSPMEEPPREFSAGSWGSRLATMARHLRSLARQLGGVARPSTYYLPWITRPGLDCTLVLSNVEARFKPDLNQGPFPVSVVQYDADGRAAQRYQVTLQDSTDTVEVPLAHAPGGCGFATVAGER